MINFHGSSKPTGVERTYPNENDSTERNSHSISSEVVAKEDALIAVMRANGGYIVKLSKIV